MDDLKLHDLGAERAILAIITWDKELYHEVEAIIGADDFQDEFNALYFSAIQEVYQEGNTPADMMVMSRKLQSKGVEDKKAVLAFQSLPNDAFAFNAPVYAKTISRLSTLRRLVRFAQASVKLAYDSHDADIDETFGKVRGWLDKITPQNTDECLLTWEQSLDAFYNMQLERLEEIEAVERGEIIPRVKFPWKALTPRFVRWMRPGMIGIFAADSSVGKTTAMECCADYWAKNGLHVAFFHLELSHQFMLDRRMVRWSGEPLSVVEGGEMTQKMAHATQRVREWPGGIHYVHCPGWSAERLGNYMRMLHDKGKCDVAVVDYLQKIRLHTRRGQTEASAWGDVVEVFKNTCEQLGICAIIGSQMNRASKDQLRRTARGIRGSGEPEEKSNLVVTFDRKIITEPVQFKGKTIPEGARSPIVEMRVDKNTAGPTGDATLVMDAERFLMADEQYGQS